MSVIGQLLCWGARAGDVVVDENNELLIRLRPTVEARLALARQYRRVVMGLKVSYFLKYAHSLQPSVLVLTGYDHVLLSLYV